MAKFPQSWKREGEKKLLVNKDRHFKESGRCGQMSQPTGTWMVRQGALKMGPEVCAP